MIDKYEYVMYGKVFKCAEAGGGQLIIHISFGGLLMELRGPV